MTTPPKPATSLIGIVGVYLLLALIVYCGGPFLLTISGLSRVNGWIFFQSRLMIWTALALLYLYAARVEKQPFLTWPDKKYKPLFYIGSLFILLVIILIASGIIKGVLLRFSHEETSPKLLEYAGLFKNNIPLLIFTALTAGVTEELIFRGYMQPRLEKAFNSPVLAIIITAFLFGALHTSYGTVFQFLVPVFIGALFSAFYSKYRNLKILILCHFLVDILSLLAITFYHSKG